MAKGKPHSPAVHRSPEIIEAILERISEGEGAQKICRDPGMPTCRNWQRWVAEDKDLQNRVAIAREQAADKGLDEIEDIARDPSIPVDRAKLIVSTKQYRLEKLAPKKYGPRMELEHSGGIEHDAGKMLAQADALLGKAFDLVDARVK